MSKLSHAIKEVKEHLELNGGGREIDGYHNRNHVTDDDAIEHLMGECGMDRTGSCSMAGTEHCDFDCPFSDR